MDDVSPWVLASEGRLAAKRSNGKVHVACGRACAGKHPMYFDVMECGGIDGMQNIKTSTIYNSSKTKLLNVKQFKYQEQSCFSKLTSRIEEHSNF